MLANIPALIADPAAWVALVTLIVMEVVLGIDNLVFISILTNKLPPEKRAGARRLGIGLAVVMRLGLLFSIAWIIQLTAPLFQILAHPVSGRDLILIFGGLFLVWKATKEIHHKIDPEPTPDVFEPAVAVTTSYAAIIGQILILDLVFSLDSVITAVGMTEHIEVMICAVVVTVIVMIVAATPFANFLDRNPTVVMLALGFLLMIGMTLIAEGLGFHVPKGYIYGAMAFSAFIETLNIWSRNRKKAISDSAHSTSGEH